MVQEINGTTIDHAQSRIADLRMEMDVGERSLAVLRFDPGWIHSALGPIIAGGQIFVEYHADRHPICGREVDLRKWWLTVWFRFRPDWNSIRSLQFVGIPWTGNEYLGAVIDVPPDATAIELWFETANVDGCRAYDSRYGANYWFEISSDS